MKRTGSYTKAETLMYEDLLQWLQKHRNFNNRTAQAVAARVIEVLRKIEDDFDSDWDEEIMRHERISIRNLYREAFYYWKDFRDRFDYNHQLPQLGHARVEEALKKQPGRRTWVERELDRGREEGE